MKLFLLSVLILNLNVYQAYGSSGSKDAFVLTLKDAEKRSIARSYDLKSYEMMIQSLDENSRAVHSKRLPQLNLEANYRYLSEVGEINLGPNKIRFGDNENYSVGPALTYTLFDGNFLKYSYEGLKALKKSKENEKEFTKKAVTLGVRLAYLNTLMKLEELKLNDRSLKLARHQNKEIKQKKKYGASGKIDLAISNRNVYNYQLKVLQKTNEFTHSFFKLITITGDINSWGKNITPLALGSAANGRLVQLDSLVKINSEIEKTQLVEPNKNNPQLESLKLLAKSHKLKAKSEQSKRWPRVFVKLKSSYNYPNGPILESINQNSASLNVTMPIWDGGDLSSRMKAENAIASSYEFKAKKMKDKLQSDWERWSTELRNLKEIKVVARKLRIEAQKVALINLKTYKAGQINFTKVERSDLKEFEAEMNEIFVMSKTFAAVAHLKALSSWSSL